MVARTKWSCSRILTRGVGVLYVVVSRDSMNSLSQVLVNFGKPMAIKKVGAGFRVPLDGLLPLFVGVRGHQLHWSCVHFLGLTQGRIMPTNHVLFIFIYLHFRNDSCRAYVACND